MRIRVLWIVACALWVSTLAIVLQPIVVAAGRSYAEHKDQGALNMLGANTAAE